MCFHRSDPGLRCAREAGGEQWVEQTRTGFGEGLISDADRAVSHVGVGIGVQVRPPELASQDRGGTPNSWVFRQSWKHGPTAGPGDEQHLGQTSGLGVQCMGQAAAAGLHGPSQIRPPPQQTANPDLDKIKMVKRGFSS